MPRLEQSLRICSTRSCFRLYTTGGSSAEVGGTHTDCATMNSFSNPLLLWFGSISRAKVNFCRSLSVSKARSGGRGFVVFFLPFGFWWESSDIAMKWNEVYNELFSCSSAYARERIRTSREWLFVISTWRKLQIWRSEADRNERVYTRWKSMKVADTSSKKSEDFWKCWNIQLDRNEPEADAYSEQKLSQNKTYA